MINIKIEWLKLEELLSLEFFHLIRIINIGMNNILLVIPFTSFCNERLLNFRKEKFLL